jgi:hypothetical protein
MRGIVYLETPVMEFLWDSVFANPLFYIGALLAGTAAMGFVLFISGFFSGVVPALKERGHIEHLFHQRARAIWGLYLMAAAYLIWKLIEWLAGAI